MQIDLTGKTALVTGSTTGIGYAIAAGLAQAGAAVIITGRDESRVVASGQKLRELAPAGASISGVAADLGTAEGCQTLIAAVPKVDILVNNVGIFGLKPFFEIEDAEWQRFFDVNVMSGVRLSRHYMQAMLQQGWGRVIFLSSESGVNIPDDMLHYGFTKTAVLGVSRGLAKLARGSGVTVNAVLPGPTLSEGVTTMLQDEVSRSGRSVEDVAKDFVKSQRPSSIIQRAATTEEVANMVVYACSQQASATTGAALRVDGGVVESII
ncbi:SDR family NAD(P)-dependent oxidoreductase [Amantichitinum ursilacus]|uniref:3-oxoacyl-[acyl-carrier-protein] reductase FabG n=1 Tax=Amantichitinum ursilacus TaxID=857265 RepID=A0A0N0GKQ5_9NEIS|nr:SDR family oxidoreductase [Amantichitinum ursilacus]KPC49074.1 3-oxoacyl-[acyl-carrier-protein] reductase FabG [Amantichitinum ursilacus]